MRTLLDGERGHVSRRAATTSSTTCVLLPPPGPGAAADHDRRLGREEDAAHRRPLRRHVERDGHVEMLRAQGWRCCARTATAVGRDPAEIERTAGCKPIIRDTEAEARRVWEAQMAHNRTPMAEVEDDDTFWVGTPELVAER